MLAIARMADWNQPCNTKTLEPVEEEVPMLAFMMMGVVSVIGFLCVSHAIPNMIERKPSLDSSPVQTTPHAFEP